MPLNQVTLSLTGVDSDESIRADDLAFQLSATSRALQAIDRLTRGKKIAKAEIRISDLSKNSPYQITFRSDLDDLCPTLLNLMDEFSTASENGRELNYPRYLLEPIRDIFAGAKKNKEVLYKQDARKITIHSSVSDYISIFLKEETTSTGSIRGMLEYMNVHEGTNTLRIYPIIGPSYVTCYFKEAIKDEVAIGMSKYVEVTGKLSYKEGSEFPYQIEVDNLEIMPDEETLPTIFEVKGMFEEMPKELANEW